MRERRKTSKELIAFILFFVSDSLKRAEKKEHTTTTAATTATTTTTKFEKFFTKSHAVTCTQSYTGG